MRNILTFLFTNTSDKQTFVKNTIWLVLGEVIGRLFKLAVVVVATRQLGIENWGIFSYALAFVSFFYILGDMGINTFITREMSKDSTDKYKYLATSLIIKIGLLIILCIASLLLGPHIGKIKLGMSLLTVVSLLYLSDCLREFALSINRSLGKMEREAFSKILMNAIITILGIVLVIQNPSPLSLAIAYTVGSVVCTLYVIWAIRAELANVQWTFSISTLKILYNFSWPIIIISLFSFVFNIDSIMLGQLKSASDVGLYSAAQRVVQFTAIIPAFIATAIFPILSKSESDDERSTRIFEKVMTIVFAIGIPLAVGGFLLSADLMTFIFGSEYTTGGMTLGILMISLLASFPNIILTHIIFSKNLQRTFIAATSIGVLLNIILNLLLIPGYGAVGAALSVATTQMFIMLVNWRKLKKTISFSIIPKIGVLTLSSIGMAIVIVILHSIGVHAIITALIAVGVYTISLLVLKEPVVSELRLLLKK